MPGGRRRCDIEAGLRDDATFGGFRTSRCGVSAARLLGVVVLGLAGPAICGPVTLSPDRDLAPGLSLPSSPDRWRVLARPLDDPAALLAGPVELDPRDLEPLDLLLRRPTSRDAVPTLGGFGRVSRSDDPTRGDLGVGGLDLSWRPDDMLSVGLVAGGRLDAVGRAGWPGATASHLDLLDPGPWPTDPVPALAARATAFDGLGFGGESAAEVSPFVSDRAYQASSAADDLRGTFLATRAVLRPLDGTSVGFVATRGGGSDGDASLVGVDVAQTLAGQRVEAWIQQAMGASGVGEQESDRAAMGASLGGALGGVRYGVGWRRIGDGFESGLGSTANRGSHAMTGRLGWALPIESIPFVRSWEFGVRARFDTDLEFDPRRLQLDIDALRLVGTGGDALEFGIRQERTGVGTDFQHADLVERFRVAVASSAARPLRLGAGFEFGDEVRGTAASWQGSARWAPGGGFDLGGSLALDQAIDDRRAADTIRTSIDGGFGVGKVASIRTRIGFDAARARLSVGQSLGLDLDHALSISVAIEQEWPTIEDPGQDGVVRARIGGSFSF